MKRIDKHTVMATVDQCIYCGATGKLSDEHAIPLALGGRLVLARASCAECARITSEFERRVLRGFMYRARNTGGFPTRHPKGRPTTATVSYMKREGKEDHVDPLTEDPALLQLPMLVAPEYLTGDSSGPGVRVQGVETLYFGPNPLDAIHRKGAIGIEQHDSLDVTSFIRLLAKIGYCYVVGAIGLPPREEVTVLPLILGHSDDGSRWVGSARFSTEGERQSALHALSHIFLRKNDDPAREVLVARVKLFASSGATGYEVIVHHSASSHNAKGE
jgi:hypothetical protein